MNRSLPGRAAGAAAVEFALAFPVVFLMLYGLMTFGAVMYAQMAISRAVHDGARAVPLLPTPAEGVSRDYTQVTTEILESLAASAIVPPSASQTLISRRAWLEANVRGRIAVTEDACPGASAGTCANIILDFPYANADGTRLFPSITIPGIGGTETWIPDTLTSAALVRL